MGYNVIQYRREHRDAFTDNDAHSSGPLILQSLPEYLNEPTQLIYVQYVPYKGI